MREGLARFLKDGLRTALKGVRDGLFNGLLYNRVELILIYANPPPPCWRVGWEDDEAAVVVHAFCWLLKIVGKDPSMLVVVGGY